MSQRSEVNVVSITFLLVFLYAISVMFLVREVLVPEMYITATDGNIPGDAEYYNSLAHKKVTEIKEQGITLFELRPNGQGTAGVASILYLLIDSPYAIVFVNALLHAFSVVLMVMIVRCWFPLRISILATIPLAISPYMIVWFSQINKDSFSLFGILLFVYGLIQIIMHGEVLLKLLTGLIFAVIGILSLWIMRPYINIMLLPITTLILTFVIAFHIWSKSARQHIFSLIIFSAAILLFLNYFNDGAASDKTLDNFVLGITKPIGHKECMDRVDVKNWQDEHLFPDYVNNKLHAIAGQRCLNFSLLESQQNLTTLNSIVDTDIFFSGARDVLNYFPKALMLGAFSPWPDRWLYSFHQKSSFFFTITPIEAFVMYFGFVGLIFFTIKYKEWYLLVPIFMAFTMMSIYGISNPFIGVLYRYRYPWWMIMICLGIASLLTLKHRFKK